MLKTTLPPHKPARVFIGVYREVNKPDQRMPVYQIRNGTHVDMFDRPVNLNDLILVEAK